MTILVDDAWNLTLAKWDLLALNNECSKLQEKPILLETAKAITLAESHKNIEARVICTDVNDAISSVLHLMKCGLGKWSMIKKTLELPNGSAVVVKLEKRTKL